MSKHAPIARIETYLAAPADHDGELYAGLPVYAMPGLHAHVAEVAAERLPAGSRMLELGCSAGALSARLTKAGFKVTSCDARDEIFHQHGVVPFVATDLNQEFAQRFDVRFPAIIAAEIIEHLENPWQFLRQCRELLEPGGTLILTTPNIDAPRAILNFVKTGAFKGFTDLDYTNDGHITPLSQWQIAKAMAAAGLDLDSMTSVGAPWGTGSVFRHLGARLLRLLARKNPSSIGTIVVAIGTREK